MNRKPRRLPEKNPAPLWGKLRRFRPPFLLSWLGAAAFGGGSLAAVSTPWGKTLSPFLLYALYTLAAVFLSAAVWALVLLCRKPLPCRRYPGSPAATAFFPAGWMTMPSGSFPRGMAP